MPTGYDYVAAKPLSIGGVLAFNTGQYIPNTTVTAQGWVVGVDVVAPGTVTPTPQLVSYDGTNLIASGNVIPISGGAAIDDTGVASGTTVRSSSYLAAQLGTIVLPDATSASATPAAVVGQTVNVSTAGAVVSAPALPGAVGAGAALARWAVKNTSTGPITVTYPNTSGTTVVSTVVPDEVKTYRQKSTSGWGTEAGSLPLTQLALSSTPLENAPAVMFGHSFGASRVDLSPGPGADIDGHALERVAVRLRTKALNTSSSQANIANYAQGGTRSDQILASIQANWTPNTRGTVFLAGGHRNDQNFYGNATPNTATVAEVFRSIFAYLTCRQVLPYTSAAFQTGAGSWSLGSAASGGVMDFAFTGDAAFIAFSAVTGSGGTFTVTNAAGTVLKTVQTGGFGVAFTGVARISGLGAGAHTVRITVTAGTVGIVGAFIPAATPPLIVWELEPPYNPAIVSGGALANTVNTQYQTATQAVVAADFAAAPIVIVDAPPTWDPTVDTYIDAVHPSGQGHGKIADRAIVKILAKVLGYFQGLNYLTGSVADPTTYMQGAVAYQAANATAPTAPTPTASSGVQLNLSWVLTNDGGATITSYDYRYSPAGAGTWTTVTGLPPATLSAVIGSGLTQGNSYDVQVRATNAVGTSAWSASSTAAAGPQGLVASDNFNRADATAGPGASWAAGSGSALTNFPVVSQQLQITNTATATLIALWATSAATADQFSQLDVAVAPGVSTTAYPRCTVRYATNGASYDSYYGCYVPGSGYQIFKVVAGAVTTLATVAASAPSLPMTQRVDVKGSTIRLLVGGSVVATTTDTTLTAGRSVGIMGRWTGATDSNQRVDNFAGGDW